MSTPLTHLMLRMNTRYLCAVACVCFFIVTLRFLLDLSAPTHAGVSYKEWDSLAWTNGAAVSPWNVAGAITNRTNPFVSPHHRRLILQHRLTRTIERMTEPEAPPPDEPPAPPEKPPEPEPEPEPAPEPRTLRLVYRGALRLMGPPTVIVSAPELGVEKVMRVDDRFEGLQLKAIESDRVIFMHGKIEHILREGLETEVIIP
jgi:hypothetical protein